MSTTHPRTRFGRSRFGGSPAALIVVSVGLGTAIATLLGWIASLFRPGDPTWIVTLIFAAATAPIWVALAWVILVDHRTLTTAVRNPEDSIEAIWLNRAAAGAFWDIVLALGLGSAALAIADFNDIQVPAGPVLAAMIVMTLLDVALRYLYLQRVGS